MRRKIRMKLLREAIEKRGEIINDSILKVDSFLNHQIDCALMEQIGIEFANYFKDGYDCLMVSGYSAHDFYEKFVQFESLTVEQKCLIGENARLTAAKYFDWRKYANVLNSFLK